MTSQPHNFQSAAMDFYISVVCRPFSDKLTFKSPSMKTVLNGLTENQQLPAPGQGVSVSDWWDLVRADDHLIVTQVSFNKQLSVWPDFQHEYITLEVSIHPLSLPQEYLAPVTLEVSRTVQATLGLWGPALDTVTIRPLMSKSSMRCNLTQSSGNQMMLLV